MSVEPFSVVCTVLSRLLSDRWHLQITFDYSIRNIPWSICPPHDGKIWLFLYKLTLSLFLFKGSVRPAQKHIYPLQRWAGITQSVYRLYGLDGPGIESRWGVRFPAPAQTGPGAHRASYTMGTGSVPGGKAAGAWR